MSRSREKGRPGGKMRKTLNHAKRRTIKFAAITEVNEALVGFAARGFFPFEGYDTIIVGKRVFKKRPYRCDEFTEVKP